MDRPKIDDSVVGALARELAERYGAESCKIVLEMPIEDDDEMVDEITGYYGPEDEDGA